MRNRVFFLSFLIFCTIGLYFVFISPQNKTYQNTFLSHKENASDKWMNYLDIYEPYLSSYVNKNASILEIGVQNGGHLQILRKYLGNAKIYGVDINQDVCKLDLDKGITVFCFDATQENLVNKNMRDLNFNIIIDDGSHNSSDVIKTFQIMFSKVTPGGLYIIEDMHTSYWKEYGGGYKAPHSQIEYFKSLIDLLNTYHINANDSSSSQDNKFYNNLSNIEKEFLEWIQSITFYDSVAVIKKFVTPRPNGPYSRVVIGVKQPVIRSIDIAKKDGYYYNIDD